jgi:hypothetical protein
MTVAGIGGGALASFPGQASIGTNLCRV